MNGVTMTDQDSPNTLEILEIDLDSIDREFVEAVASRPGGANIKRCYACGACSARCPVGDVFPEFDPRRLIRLAVLGMKEKVLAGSLLWFCATCFTCQETCPQGVNFTEIMFALKNMATEAGCFPPAMSAQIELLETHGRLYEITDFENEKRVELGLPGLSAQPEHYRTMLEGLKSRLKSAAACGEAE